LSTPERVDATLLDRLLTKCNDKLSLLASGGLVDRDFHIDGNAVGAVLDVVRHNVPLVIVDVPNVWAAWTKYTLVHADDVVITATPELASLRNAKNMFDVLKAARPNDSVPKIVLNQVGVPKRPEIPVADFAKALGVEPLAVFPYDPQVFGTASSNGQMIIEVAPKSRAAEVVNGLASQLSGREAPKPAAKFSLFSSLRKK
jgi:pilus assembly protein CpaE